MVEISLKGEIPSKKNRWHISRHGGMYKDKTTNDWEANALADIMEQKIPKFAGKYFIHMIIYFSRDRDLDNSVTTILDVLQEARVIDNDRNVYELAVKKVKSKRPGALIQIQLIK